MAKRSCPCGLPAPYVEFRAHFSRAGRTGHMHEVSRFVRENGAWVYLDAAPT
ncbi:YchJ family metal-binding protein [Nonomuraea typhae]|uniref:YchJ family metal-binding protein n=1 Tax=Nonomuraea typhae TaxID=2603600 RepID=UPI0012FBC5D3|nr:YchJ family metal-binding protein [Nonomuraea typhae]